MRNATRGVKALNGLHRARFLSVTQDGPRSLRFPPRALPVADEFSILGLSSLASKTDVKYAYKRLALKYHPDVIRRENEKPDIFKEIKSAYESLMIKFEEAESVVESQEGYADDYDEWEEWMGFEGGMPVAYNAS